MEDAWFGCVVHAISEDEALERFRSDTGIDLKSFARRGVLIQAVDEATGYERFVMLKFLDWVTEHVWGEEETPLDFSELDNHTTSSQAFPPC